MKRFIKYTIAIICLPLVFGLFSGCKKDFLDITPKGELILSDVADYDHLLNNFNLLNTNASAQLFLGDDVIAVDPYFSGAPLINQRLFRYEAEVYQPNQDANETKALLPQLYTFNKVINEVLNAANGTDAQKQAIRADALAGRAINLFMLINYYGKPYNAATAATDPGFPIITTADVTQTKFSRGTVQQTYDQIISDLTAAIPYVNQNPISNVRMSKCAAECMLGKVLVFMGKYADALPYFKDAFNDIPTSLRSALYDYNVLMRPGGAWGYDPVASQTDFTFNSPVMWYDQESIYAKQLIVDENYDASDILLNVQTKSLFTASDMRLNFFSPQPFGGGSYPQVPGALRKTGTIQTPIGVTMPELYLLLAECQARTGDLSGANETLTTFRKSRMPAGDAAVNITDQTALIKFVINERQREFVMKGYRWFDMRRLSTDPIFANTQYSHTFVDASGHSTVYPLDPARFTMRIPAKILLENPGMSDNP